MYEEEEEKIISFASASSLSLHPAVHLTQLVGRLSQWGGEIIKKVKILDHIALLDTWEASGLLTLWTPLLFFLPPPPAAEMALVF